VKRVQRGKSPKKESKHPAKTVSSVSMPKTSHYQNIRIVLSTTIVMAVLVVHSATPQPQHQFQSVRLASLDDSQTKKVSFSKTQTVRSAKNVFLDDGVTRSVAQKIRRVLIAIQEDTRQQLHRPKKVTVLSAMLENILN